MDGPRPARPEEMPQVVELIERVFCDDAGRPRCMQQDNPLLVCEANAPNVLITADQGRPVSVMCVDRRTVVTRGCRIPGALLGSVCTHPDYRGRGLGTELLQAVYDHMRRRGVPLVWISGGRGLYLASGAVKLSQRIARATPAGLNLPADPSLEVVPLDPVRDLGELAALNHAEPVHFEWDAEWLRDVAPIRLGGRIARGYLLRRGGRTVAALCVDARGGKDTLRLIEWFGDRGAVLAALGRVAADLDPQEVTCWLPATDADMISRLGRAGFTVEPPDHGWTHKLVDVAGVLAALQPHLRTTLGDRSGALVSTDGALRVTINGASWQAADDGASARVLFATPEDTADLRATMPPEVRDLVARALPVPLKQYGLNYV